MLHPIKTGTTPPQQYEHYLTLLKRAYFDRIWS